MADKTRQVEMGSERSFGLVFAIVFAIIALWPLVRGGLPRWWALGAAVMFLGLACLWPAVLRPLNLAWFRLGLLLSSIVTPVVMALLYVTTFVPTGLILRLMGRDVLGMKWEPKRPSYWMTREPSVPTTMKRQF